ncbi:MAG TPA: glutathione S-transferase C-terminal domain-containing protein [Azospirillaceae bacterium]|nr:glutathione S-transferase C-terminal domain-containing protein [Azospirillaceae bacterium]
MITLFTFGSPHGHRASIMLEELGLPYRLHLLEFTGGPIEDPGLLGASPMGKAPALLDERDGSKRRIFGSGAILTYLAAEAGRFLPTEPVARAEAESWFMMAVADLSPASIGHFRFSVLAPERQDYAVDYYRRELERCYDALDLRLREAEYLGGAEYGIADIACYPFIDYAFKATDPAATHPGLARWYNEVGARPAVQRGMQVPPLAL